MTNTQSHEDGALSEDEFRWLTMRAAGGFGMTMTCAAHVQAVGKGFPGQLGIHSDSHLPGLTRLAEAIKSHGSVPITQLHHAGSRSPADLIGQPPVSCSEDPNSGTIGLTSEGVQQVVNDFAAAAKRAVRAGFSGIEIHGAHGYLITQFLSAESNQRTDAYGGSLENRSRFLFQVINEIRNTCPPDFLVGVRLSPERYGLRIDEMVDVSRRLMDEQTIDFLDLSLWDAFKEPESPAFQGRRLASYFTELDRGAVRLGVAGNIRTAQDAVNAMDLGLDWVMIGRSAIIHHDFPNRCLDDPSFQPKSTPVSTAHLAKEGLADSFIEYMRRWPGFVEDD